MCSGLVKASKTSRRGAPKTRVRTMVGFPGSATSSSVLAGTFLLLPLHLLQMDVQAFEALFPESPVALHPVGDLLEPVCLEPAGPALRIASTHDQAGALEHAEMLGDGRQAHVERLGELGDRSRTRGQAGQNRTPGGIGEGSESGVEMISAHGLCNQLLK